MGVVRTALSDRLGLRLVLATLLISTLFSAVASGVQLYLSYQRQVGSALEIVGRVSATSLEPLQNALWQFDFEQVDIILRGIQSDPAVAHVVLNSSTGHRFEYGDPTYLERETVFALEHDSGANREVIGELRFFLSLENIWADLWAQFLTLIATNLIKAYLVAFALLLVYYWYVTRHLTKVARRIEEADQATAPLSLILDRPTASQPDAIDKIVAALNDMSLRSSKHIEILEKEIAHRKKAEIEARSASLARKRFLANMSHEIRTPLNAMMGLFQLIEMSDVPERQKKQAATGLDAANVLLAQLTNVLEVSRLEANAVQLHPRVVKLKALAEQWRDTAIGSVTRYEKDIKVLLQVDDDVPENACFDDKRVTQIVHNLCDNAAKFTADGAILIHIQARQTGQAHDPMFDISVSDTGPGLSGGDTTDVFERFAQVDDSLTRRHSGTGLGLSISRDLANLMGGQLEVEYPSSRDNYTTTFILRIPRGALGEEAA